MYIPKVQCDYCLYHIQIRKAIELCEQLRQRMGVVIVGPSGSGKTTLWQLLKAALQKMGNSIKSYTMNPKAMPRTQVMWQAVITHVPPIVCLLTWHLFIVIIIYN